jgi:proteic killer suppression protein
MIRSSKDKETEKLLNRVRSRKWKSIEKAARVKLALLNAATSLKDLSLPGLRLEKLLGDRAGQYSIRINDQFRICFRWRDGDAYDVEVTDYHD